MKRTTTTALAAVASLAVACGGDASNTCEVTPWDSRGFEINAAEALALREAIYDLQQNVIHGSELTVWDETPEPAPTLPEVRNAYESGSPSIRDMTPGPLDALMDQTFADWVDAMASAPSAYDFIDANGDWTAPGVGGVHERPLNVATHQLLGRFGVYSASGVEFRQLIDKGLFVGTLFNYALSLTEGTITPATIHAIAAAWGANPQLNASPADGEPPVDDTANYARTMGLFDETAAALTAALSHAGNEACTAERDAALVEFFNYWEEAVFARVTYYLHVPTRSTLDPANPGSILDSMHFSSEGYGLMNGVRELSVPTSGPLAGWSKKVADADIERVLETMGMDLDDISAGPKGRWLTEEPSTYVSGLGTLRELVQSEFGWSDEQFETHAFRPAAAE